MVPGEYILELANVFYSGQVEPGSCFQRVTGGIKTGLILKDVSMTVRSGEVLAVLGSKGSGKKALLDVIARRVQGPMRGQILLNNHPMSLSVFQQRCGYVTHKCNLIPGLTVAQTLYYAPVNFSGYLKRTKIKQVMADLALSQVANKCVENLTKSEYRRLMIGVQLIKDPVILLLDEPTWDLDPLNTYLVVSILSNASKKYGTAIILTMEKPRSDVFPFLERVLYLCLGDVVYTGGTRHMLEYFNGIGFPCPQLENPLMYYLCLSTVDRRSRERFVESNHQIAALVEKFKMEGAIYQKITSNGVVNMDVNFKHHNSSKGALMSNRPNCCQIGWSLYSRLLVSTLNFKTAAMKRCFLRLFTLPLMFFILWIFYKDMKNFQHTFITRNGLIFNCLALTYFTGILNTILLYPAYRTRYYQESQEGMYGSSLFLLTYNSVSIPFALVSVFGASAIIYSIFGTFGHILNFLYFALILWSCYIFTEQQTIAILMVVKNHLTAAVFSIYITCICLLLGSGILRSMKGLQDWLFYLTYGTHVRYAGAFLSRQLFLTPELRQAPPFDMSINCTNTNNLIETVGPTNPYCRYSSGQHFLIERYSRTSNELIFSGGILDFEKNLGIAFAFTIGIIVFNLFLYLLPLPAFVKAKFRE